MTIKQECIEFLDANFNGLKIRQPLFYNWDIGLRFDLQVGATDTDEYFIECVRRASALFEAAFSQTDEVYLVLLDFKYKRKKIRFPNYCFKQIKNLQKKEVAYSKIKWFYESEDLADIRNQAIVRLSVDRCNYKNILTAISHVDFPPRKPSYGFLSSKQVFFLNINKKIIFHMYDDRGLDIIASDKATLLPIYDTYNDWILDFDRASIDQNMNIAFN
ncbi:DUF3885 domain-containing protein [Dyadobacter sp. NIV53]|uniref:DUF3885 domain-containing protein n=1 Tax=Dyadobacter sp. NIV53 TaxID=2861765 RepID=UPI001C885CE8|nr:DUF3885 domain-containing protein [Dyadobacter sp. NIV53]